MSLDVSEPGLSAPCPARLPRLAAPVFAPRGRFTEAFFPMATPQAPQAPQATAHWEVLEISLEVIWNLPDLARSMKRNQVICIFSRMKSRSNLRRKIIKTHWCTLDVTDALLRQYAVLCGSMAKCRGNVVHQKIRFVMVLRLTWSDQGDCRWKRKCSFNPFS